MILHKFSKRIVLLVLSSFLANIAIAAPPSTPFLTPREQMQQTGPAEYVFKNDSEELLIPVFLLGAVQRPGLYHVPAHTDLTTLITISGGPTDRAILDQVQVKHHQSNYKLTEVDFREVLTNPEVKSPILAGNDVIYLKARQPLISSETALTVTVIASVLGIVATSFILAKGVK